VHEKILERFGHQNLNTLAEFEAIVPTTENLCVEVFDILERDFHRAQVDKVRIEETMLNAFEYAGGREIRY
jgi:6-pyruvoyltetrahydropterin/6-carboxytetrahydropterin synthase